MQQAKLTVQSRETFGKQHARALRRAGDFPGGFIWTRPGHRVNSNQLARLQTIPPHLW